MLPPSQRHRSESSRVRGRNRKCDGYRSPFWWFWLFVVIVQVVVQSLLAVIVGTDSILYSLLVFVLAIALAIPLYAAGSRRMHDTGKSGWLQLLVLIPCAGIIIMIVLWAQQGSGADNQYGAPPA